MKTASRHRWVRRIRGCEYHIAVATVYAVLYLVLVQVSDGAWAITAGLRLSFLLLTPYRYWPALFVAESVPLGYHLKEIALHSGWTAAALCAIPPIAVAMPVVAFFRKRAQLAPHKGAVDVGALVLCALLLSVLWAAISYGILWTAKAPANEQVFHVNINQFMIMLVGQYAGCMTMLPIVLVWALNYRPMPLRQTLNHLAGSRLVLDMALFLAPVITLLLLVTPSTPPDVAAFCRILMFTCLGILTVKHGWAAAAVGSAGIIAAIALTGPAHACTTLMVTQAFACFAVTALLLVGADREGGRYLLHRSSACGPQPGSLGASS